MNPEKKRMPELGEAFFSMGYLLFGAVAAIVMLAGAKGRDVVFLYGILTLVLVCGDAFHLVPRIRRALAGDYPQYTAQAGIGLMVSSITMTVFYVILLKIWKMLNPAVTLLPAVEALFMACALLRVILCLCPQNRWTKKDRSEKWGLYRNAPFAVMGAITVILAWVSGMRALSVAVLISFACYLPVVLWGRKYPRTGMLMIPKTMAYIWMICMGLNLM